MGKCLGVNESRFTAVNELSGKEQRALRIFLSPQEVSSLSNTSPVTQVTHQLETEPAGVNVCITPTVQDALGTRAVQGLLKLFLSLYYYRPLLPPGLQPQPSSSCLQQDQHPGNCRARQFRVLQKETQTRLSQNGAVPL